MTILAEQSSRSNPYVLPHTINEAVFNRYGFINPKEGWEMSRAEAFALIMLLRELTPDYAIEIGTSQGGSLSVISRFAKRVYSIDIDPTCHERLGLQYPNTEFIAGHSQEILPPLLRQLQEAEHSLEFVLIDGDHSQNGVNRDIENVLQISSGSNAIHSYP